MYGAETQTQTQTHILPQPEHRQGYKAPTTTVAGSTRKTTPISTSTTSTSIVVEHGTLLLAIHGAAFHQVDGQSTGLICLR